MRIAFLAYRGAMTSGGQGIYLHHLTSELARRGHRIDCFVGPPYPTPMPWARVTRIENQQFWGKSFDPRPGAFLPRPDPFRIFAPLNFYEYAASRFGFLTEPFAFSLRAARAVLDRMRRGASYDLVHDVQSAGYGLLWLRALGLPVLTTIHHPLSVDRRASLARDRSLSEIKGTLTFYPVGMQRRVARRLDAVLTSSRASAAGLRRDYGVSEDRLHVVWNGVGLPPLGSGRKRPAQDWLLFVGRCGDPNKGLEFLLDALARLPASIRLRVLDEPQRNTAVSREIERLRLADRVRFDGKLGRAGLERAYLDASVVVVPSVFEGFGLPAVEALAAGTPVVATSAGALPEVLGAAQAGRLVPPRDPAALAAAILDTLRSWAAEHERACKARARIEVEFAWDRVAKRTEDVYLRTLARQGMRADLGELGQASTGATGGRSEGAR
jgi:glycosyltransferase involved in cell wall biosynthesis